MQSINDCERNKLVLRRAESEKTPPAPKAVEEATTDRPPPDAVVSQYGGMVSVAGGPVVEVAAPPPPPAVIAAAWQRRKGRDQVDQTIAIAPSSKAIEMATIGTEVAIAPDVEPEDSPAGINDGVLTTFVLAATGADRPEPP